MSHQEQIESTDELTSAIQSVVEYFEPYRADHRPDLSDVDVRQLKGASDVPEEDAELMNEALRAWLAAIRRREGRE